MGIRYLHLIRHGQYHTDKAHHKNGSLTRVGQLQAKKVANRLKDYEISVIHSSTMMRAEETADIIAREIGHKNIKKSKLLVEGVPEFPEKLRKKFRLTQTQMRKTKTRMNKAFKKYFKPIKKNGEKHEVLVCHGNVIRYLVTKALKVDTLTWIKFDIFQCSLTTLSIDENQRVKLIVYGEIGHVSKSKRTYI